MIVTAFSAGVDAWRRRLGLTRNVVRQELVRRQLLAHLGDLGPPGSVRVLDVGCGQATVAIGLAAAGYDVTGIDPSEALLAAAVEHAAEAGVGCTFLQGDLDQLAERAPGRWDVVCCHGVLMYLPDLAAAVRTLATSVRPGGLISVLTRNRPALAMRAGLAGDWDGARSGFDARYYDNRVGISGVRADEPSEVAAALAGAGAETVAWYGVRLFTDHWPDVEPPADIGRLLAAEEEAGRRDPYRQLAALTHTLGRRLG